jgi:ribonuclease HII
VILDPARLPRGLDDSKAMTAEAREKAFEKIMERALAVGIACASVEEIDEINILQATMLAMRRATEQLSLAPVMAFVDGNRAPALACPVETIIEGDAKSMSIAAASIVAKVTRDRIMCALDQEHPGYNWASNKGYGTRDHLEALDRLGPTVHHRKSFAPVAQLKLPFAS